MNTLTHNELEHCFRLSAQYEISPIKLNYISNKMDMTECTDYYHTLKAYSEEHDPIWKTTESNYEINFKAMQELNKHLYKQVDNRKDKANMKVTIPHNDPKDLEILKLKARLTKATEAYRFMEAIIRDYEDKDRKHEKDVYDRFLEEDYHVEMRCKVYEKYNNTEHIPLTEDEIADYAWQQETGYTSVTEAIADNLDTVFEKCTKLYRFVHAVQNPGYAHYTYKGYYDVELEQHLGHAPTQDEIIFLVDHMRYNFGYKCTIDYETRTFFGKINID